MLKTAELNPWSHGLSDPEIKIVLGDASKVIREIPDESFDRVIHDPPRFSLADELYSLDFYREIHRVLRRRGVVFHYTGEPRVKRRTSSIVKGVSRRLKTAGFRVLRVKEVGGFLAYKY